MLFSPVFVKLQPDSPPGSDNILTFKPSYRSSLAAWRRRSRSGRDVLTSFTPKSLPLNLFADPNPLNPVVSILYENIGGAGGHFNLFPVLP